MLMTNQQTTMTFVEWSPFCDNRGKSLPKWQTIMDFTATIYMEIFPIPNSATCSTTRRI